MKKKVLATLLAGALMGASAVSFASCGGVSMPKGDQVTKEEWAEFIAAMAELKNYTLDYSADVNVTLNGTTKEVKDYSNPDPAKMKEEKVTGETKTSMAGTTVYDSVNNKAYVEGTESSQIDMKSDDEKMKASAEETDKAYYELKEEGVYWKAAYAYEMSELDGTDIRRSEKSESYWIAGTTFYFADNTINIMFSDSTFYETKDGTEEKNIAELFEKFTYSAGVYTATLYKEVEIYGEMNGMEDVLECKVTISFNKAEKCVTGYGVKTEGEGNLKADETYYSYDMNYTYKGESVYAVTKIKTTDVSEKVNKDISKALEKAKAEAAEANA